MVERDEAHRSQRRLRPGLRLRLLTQTSRRIPAHRLRRASGLLTHKFGEQRPQAPRPRCLVEPRPGVIVSFQQIDTVAADQAVASPMRRLGM